MHADRNESKSLINALQPRLVHWQQQEQSFTPFTPITHVLNCLVGNFPLSASHFLDSHNQMMSQLFVCLQIDEFWFCFAATGHCSPTHQNANPTVSTDLDATFTDQPEPPENQVDSITVSRTPPWRKNSILNQQPVVSVESANISNANSRVPPLPQQHLLQTQPPWQEETQKRRNNTKKRPNFKDDPTGYLNHQTAILHNSILNVHSPDLQDTDSSSSTSQGAYRQATTLTSRIVSHSSADAVNLLNNNAIQNNGAPDDHNQQQMSVMQQQQQNQNVYIQQFDSMSKNQMIIGSNGQAMRIVPNTAPVIYSNASDFPLSSANSTVQIAQPIVKVNEFVGGKRTQNPLITTPTVQMQANNDHQQMNALTRQQPPQPFSSPKIMQQSIVMSQHDQGTAAAKRNKNVLGLPIDVAHLPNGTAQVHQNCDSKKGKSQPQTILLKSNQMPRMAHPQVKLNDHQYILPTKSSILTRLANIESSVSSSTANKPTIIEIQTAINGHREPSQVGTISTSNESPPISSPAPSISPETSATMESHQMGKSYTSVYVAGQTSGRNTITSVLAGKAMTSTTTTNQFAFVNDKNRMKDASIIGNHIQIHDNRILRPPQQMHLTKQQNNIMHNASVNIKSMENTSQQNLPNIQIQQPNQIIMTSSGCQILVMPSQNSKNSNPMIIGQPPNANTLVVNNGSGQQNVVLNPQNMIGSELIQGINDSSLAGATHSSIMQNTGNNVVLQSPNLIQPPNNVITNGTNSNYIVSSPNAIQPMIINNSNLLSHNGNVMHHAGPNVIQTNTNNILATANSTKVISNAGNLLSSPNILTNQSLASNNQFIGSNNSGALLSPNNGGIVLNQLSNASYVIQPQSFTTVDGQVVNVINSDNGSQFVQQTQQRIILSPDSKRRVKKRKSSSVSPQGNSPQQSPTIQTPPQPTVLQIAPQYHQSHQSFQTTIEVRTHLMNKFNCILMTFLVCLATNPPSKWSNHSAAFELDWATVARTRWIDDGVGHRSSNPKYGAVQFDYVARHRSE